MYSAISALHLTHRHLRRSGQLLCTTLGRDPDPHQCIWLRARVFEPVENGTTWRDPHRNKENTDSTQKGPPHLGIEPRAFLLSGDSALPHHCDSKRGKFLKSHFDNIFTQLTCSTWRGCLTRLNLWDYKGHFHLNILVCLLFSITRKLTLRALYSVCVWLYFHWLVWSFFSSLRCSRQIAQSWTPLPWLKIWIRKSLEYTSK